MTAWFNLHPFTAMDHHPSPFIIQCRLVKAESLEALTQGNALCDKNYDSSSPVRAQAYALTGLKEHFVPYGRALPYSVAFALAGLELN
jgi:hypothetical protein